MPLGKATSETTIRVIAAYVLSGRTNGEIADILGLGEGYVSALRGSDLFEQQMGSLAETLESESLKTAKILHATAPKSAELIQEIIESDRGEDGVTARLQFDAAKDILDRTGNKAAEEVVIRPADNLIIIRNADEFDEADGQEAKVERALLDSKEQAQEFAN